MKPVSVFVVAAVLWLGVSTLSHAVFGDPERGKQVYSQRCAMCHGMNGDGNNGMAANFQQEWHRFTKSDEELAESIRNGFQTSGKHYTAGAMPPQFLTDRELDDVISYLRETFGGEPKFSDSPPPR